MAERFGAPPGITQGDIGARYTRKRLADEVYIGHYIKAGDRIRVRSTILAGVIASLTTVNLTIGGRVQGMDGDLVPFGDAFTLTADGVQTAQYVMAPEGYVVDLIVQSTSTGLTSGDLTVIVDIVQGVGSNAVAVGLLAYGYVYPAGLLGLNVSRNIGGGSGGGMAIGGTVTGGTAKSVLFLNAGPVLAEDNTNFTWDDATNNLRIGPGPQTSPGTAVNIQGNGLATFAQLALEEASGGLPRLMGTTNGGTLAVPAGSSSGTDALEIVGRGVDSSGSYENCAELDISIDGAPSATAVPGSFKFYTSQQASAGLIERLRITALGATGLAALSANTSVAIAGQLEVQSSVVLHGGVAFASLPASPVAGMVAYITDSNAFVWGATIAGGSTHKVLGFYNGTNWTVAGA